MAEIFIGVVINTTTKQVEHEHIASNSEESFTVDIWDDDKAIIQGEFRKWHHLTNLIDKQHPYLVYEQYSGDTDALALIKYLSK